MPQLHDEGDGVKERLTSSDRDRPDAPGTQPGPCVSVSTNRSPAGAGEPCEGRLLTFLYRVTGPHRVSPSCWCQCEGMSYTVRASCGVRDTSAKGTHLCGYRNLPTGSNGPGQVCPRQTAPASLKPQGSRMVSQDKRKPCDIKKKKVIRNDRKSWSTASKNEFLRNLNNSTSRLGSSYLHNFWPHDYWVTWLVITVFLLSCVKEHMLVSAMEYDSEFPALGIHFQFLI